MSAATSPLRARRDRTAACLACAAVLSLVLTGCAAQASPQPSSTPTTTQQPSPTPTSPQTPSDAGDPTVPLVETVVDGLNAPWSIAFAGDAALVSERDSGRILEIVPGNGTRELATISGVVHGGEGGLLGIAVHDAELYAYSTGANGNRIERYPLAGKPGSFTLGAGTTIIDGIPAATSHNGGRIAFGPDGMFYATTGDAGSPERAQDLSSLAGKILRLTPEGGIPNDNPFPGSPVFTWGHRNPQGIAWTTDGTMLASELGQDTWDELNVIEAGKNYGWPTVEGSASLPEFKDPVQQWAPAQASPSGLAVWGDAVFLANLRGELLRAVSLIDIGVTGSLADPLAGELFAGDTGRLRDAVVAPDGSLWVMTNNTDGRRDPLPGDDRILRLTRST